jgi:DNA uptake protein ComE-like DNA-binding protein
MTSAELAKVPGVGPAKLERYGDEVLRVLGRVAS